MKHPNSKHLLGFLAASTFICTAAIAQDVTLIDGVEARPNDNTTFAAGAFQKDGPWTIAMSHFGVNANTWTVQTAHEAQGIVSAEESAVA